MNLKRNVFSVCLVLFLTAGTAVAEDKLVHFTLENARQNDSATEEVLSGDIAMYWGKQRHPAIVKSFGTFKSSKRTNAFMKTQETACSHALASALLSFADRARKEGGNAVIELESNIKNRPESSTVEYSCLVGNIMVNVALKGRVVKLAK